jgi:hypothetical protein
VQGYVISSDSALGTGQTVEKYTEGMTVTFFEKHRRTNESLTLLKFSIAVWCCTGRELPHIGASGDEIASANADVSV